MFQSGFNQIAIQQSNQQKLNKALPFASSNCFTSAQVKNLAMLFTEDSYRLDFCKTAYAHTTDPANFFDVYDAFGTFSWAFRLYDYVNKKTVAVVTPVSIVQTPVFPNYAYPGFSPYKGKTGCTGPVVSEESFKTIAQNVFIQPTDESKYVAIQTAADQHCLAFAHIMKLTSLMQSESLKLRVLMNTFARVYDQENYQSGIVLFSTTASQNEWINYAKAYLTPPPPVCLVTDPDFNGILKDIQAKHFADDKMGIVKLLAKDRCFSVAQIRTISKEFPFGTEKLSTFKSLYAKCTDKNNYYKLVDELTFSSEKDDLRNFIKNDGK